MKRYAGSCRFVYNQALGLQKERLENNERLLNYAKLCRSLTGWKGKPEVAWLSDAPSHALQQSLEDLDRAFANWRAGRADFPTFKRKGTCDSFRYPDGFRADQDNSRVFLPKTGWVRYRNSRFVEGKPKNVTISERCGRWYASIQTEIEIDIPEHPGGSVGLDVGIIRFVTLSDGTHHEPLHSFRKHENSLRRVQQSLSRRKRGSNNWKKQKQRIGRIHARIADVRNDYLHRISSTIGKNHAMVFMEDLKVSNMSRSAKGTRENPGSDVRVKSGLNKAIPDQGWGEFRRQLEYKTRRKGGSMVPVNPRNTSRTCPECRFTSKSNRHSQSGFVCESCGFHGNADVVAAMNIRRVGQTRIACEVSDAVMSPAAGTHRNDLLLRDAAWTS